MRQATLLFGGRGSESSIADAKDDFSGEIASKEKGNAAPPAKRVRRAATQKSQEQIRKQSQMTFGQDGQLCKQDAKDNESIVVEDSDTDDEPVVRTTKRKVLVKELPEATSKPKEPISLTVKGTQRGPDEATHAFFAKRPASKETAAGSVISTSSLAASARQRWPQGKDAPWPDSTNMHVQPKEYESQDRPFKVSSLSKEEHKVSAWHSNGHSREIDAYPWQAASYASSSAVCVEDLDQIGNKFYSEAPHVATTAGSFERKKVMTSSHAAEKLRQSSASDESKSRENGTLWVDQCRPTRAEDCLGNETRAIQLRDWLNELRISGVNCSEQSRSRIIRRKQKREKKGALDGFVVDDEEDEAWYDHFRKPTRSKEDLDHIDEEDEISEVNQEGHLAILSNAMLLTGPTGSGKTAAVYACAAELGFEVFEIYPGQGRRSGKDISQAVGDLGRNHMVSSGGTGGGSTWKGFKAAKVDSSNRDVEVAKKAIKAAPRESLILIEEVDLLFEEDKGFWAAVIELIAASKRPVIMTCNHLYNVPLESMYLQDTLHFKPPSIPSAIDYLKAMAQVHGKSLQDAAAEAMCIKTAGMTRETTRLAELLMPSSGMLDSSTDLVSIDKSQEGVSTFDLRQAIMQLQYHCQSDNTIAKKGERVDKTNGFVSDYTLTSRDRNVGSPTKNVLKSTETQSFCDSFLIRPAQRECELLEPDEYEYVKKTDDVQCNDMIALPKMRVKLETSTLAELGREEDYEFALIGKRDASFFLQSQARRRIEYSTLLLDLMKKMLVSAHYQIPSTAIVTDYAPVIDNMIKVDDVEQQAYHTHLLQAVQEVNRNRQSPNEEETDSLKAARSSLLQMGIRPSRHTTRILLERGTDGLLSLARKESAPCRWISIDEDLLKRLRQNRIFPSSLNSA